MYNAFCILLLIKGCNQTHTQLRFGPNRSCILQIAQEGRKEGRQGKARQDTWPRLGVSIGQLR